MNNELLTAGNLYGSLINDIGNILVEARGKICREINSVMVDAYRQIHCRIRTKRRRTS